MPDSHLVYLAKLTTYMEDKMKKATFCNIRRMGSMQHRYEVLCKERFRCGVKRQLVVQECQIMPNGIFHWPCMKQLLLYRPCSHIIVACTLMNMIITSFVSPHYLKELVPSTYYGEIYGYEIVGTFTANRESDYCWALT
jgi:hypothetical protein